MSVKLVAKAFETTLPPTDKLILICLADATNDDGRGCWFLIKTLCAKCSVSESTVQRSLRKMEEHGLLTRNYRKGRSTVFALHPEAWPMQQAQNGGCQFDGGVTSDTRGVSPMTPRTITRTKGSPLAREYGGGISREVGNSTGGGQHQNARMASTAEEEVF